MTINLNVLISIIAALIAVFSLIEAKRANRFTRHIIRMQSYEKTRTLPDAEIIKAISVDGITRAQLVIFNNRTEPLRVHCVKTYIYEPKPRTIINWVRSHMYPFDWDYSLIELARWNPKGNLDDKEHFLEDTIQFTMVKEKEFLLVTIPEISDNSKFKFEVITSQGISTTTGHISYDKRHLSSDFTKTIV